MIDLLWGVLLVGGMLGAYYMGARKGEEKIINRKFPPEDMDNPPEISEEEYLKHIKAWTQDGESENSG